MALDSRQMETIKKIAIYFGLVILACVGTLVFMCFHFGTYAQFDMADWMAVLGHSLPHHLTVAGYVMALPMLLCLVRVWWPKRKPIDWHTRFMMIYMAVMMCLLVQCWAVNLVLYDFWGIVLDGTALFYILDNPADALAESPLWAVVLLVVLLSAIAWGTARLMRWLFGDAPSSHPVGMSHRGWQTLGIVLLCGLDFLAIRGGWSPATMNPGRAYFSDAMPLNHAAVDPVFNFAYSVSKTKRFDQQYRFMSAEEALAAMDELNRETASYDGTMAEDSVMSPDRMLRSERPNILLIILESFSGSACHYLTPTADEGWMPSINRLMGEGLAFTNFYANSFRTDRGVAAVLAAYPGQPTNSVMKDQAKCDNLQYLSKRLGEAGYQLQFVHGGDVNFTNMKGFLRSGGITHILADSDFPVSERLDKWGVRDDRMFDALYDEIVSSPTDKPWFKTMLTLSSHEPFEVPFARYEDPYLNSVAYTDSCLGHFIDRLKSNAEVWDNLLVIGLPDHCYARFPADVLQHDPARYHIPMFWTGGAVSEHKDVEVMGQQTDLAATLLGQLGIGHADFNFSKDMFDPAVGHYAFYAFSDGFGLLTDSCQYVQDNKRSGVGLQPGTSDPEGKAERWGKAYLQRLYDDLQKR